MFDFHKPLKLLHTYKELLINHGKINNFLFYNFLSKKICKVFLDLLEQNYVKMYMFLLYDKPLIYKKILKLYLNYIKKNNFPTFFIKFAWF